jgi:phospholipid-binding lipoprotein MlaA
MNSDTKYFIRINTMKSIALSAIYIPTILGFLLMTGCASGPQANPTDPLEPFNRSVYSFNDGIDRAVLKPVAEGYRAVTPRLVRAGVSNFFNNLEDLWSSLNGVLQLRPQVAVDNFMRFSTNSVFGLGGVFDIASEAGIERKTEDLGKTLGRWGVPAGPYIVLPLLGPSTVRDASTIIVERRYSPLSQINDNGTRNSLTVLNIVDTRTNLLRLTNMLDEMALDKYSFTRDAFLQRRRADIYRPGQEKDDERLEMQEKK